MANRFMAGQVNIVFDTRMEIYEKMTVLQALQSMLEYENDNLLTKALLDRGVSTTSATYVKATHEKIVDLAATDIYLVLINHPNFVEGSKTVDFKPGALMALRNELLRKWGLLPVTVKAPVDSRYQKIW
jgi:hypothetical protein